jgi:hypothetical protein
MFFDGFTVSVARRSGDGYGEMVVRAECPACGHDVSSTVHVGGSPSPAFWAKELEFAFISLARNLQQHINDQHQA